MATKEKARKLRLVTWDECGEGGSRLISDIRETIVGGDRASRRRKIMRQIGSLVDQMLDGDVVFLSAELEEPT